jgi:ubiquinone/menaquinone biosynthesis C-methylase UbiE
MAVTDPDATADAGAHLKRGMRGAYDHAASRYAAYIAPTFRPVALRLLALARPNSDDLHIDLATGTGLLPALADERRMMTCIPPWRAALDQSREMLRHARTAAPSTRLVQGDLERLPLRTNVADLLTLSFALHHLPAPRTALAEFRRVLRPRGRLVLAAWGDELSALWQAFDAWFEAAGLGESRRPQQNDDRPQNTVEAMREALAESGFPDAEITQERPPLVFPTLDDFWEWRVSFPATHRVISALPPDERARLKADSLQALRPLAGNGDVRADQSVLFVWAR